ncbi:MAG: RNase adapter RapZ [Clostridia bacterium]|nr:RNase adapter RapZ [Clostridia bacterium]
MHLVVITGMSGAGKSQALNILEDMDYYCIDNMPPMLIEEFVKLYDTYEVKKTSNIAVGVDIRGGEFFYKINDIITSLKKKGIKVDTLFLDADDETLISRYQESRRTHPLSRTGRIKEGIDKEREIMSSIRESSTYVIDTAAISIRELKDRIVSMLSSSNNGKSGFPINIITFGFKYGMPNDVDMVFDVRFIDNPYYIKELREKTGLDKPVHDYVMDKPEAKVFLAKLTDMVDYLVPLYIKEGKGRLSIAIGCTGGRHRSVTIAEELSEHLKRTCHRITTNHLNINK